MKKLSIAVVCAAMFTAPLPATVFLGADEGTAFPDPGPNAAAAEAAFAAAAGATTLIDFESVPAGAIAGLSPVTGVTLTGQNSEGGNQQVTDTPACAINCGGNNTAGGIKFVELFGNTLTVSFDKPISAFGVYVGGVQDPSVMLTFDDGAPQAILLDTLGADPLSGVAALNFVGFVDTTRSIRSVTLNAGNDVVSFDDLRFSFAATMPAVPEPTTWAMMIGGFGLAGGALRSRSRLRAALR